MPLLDFFNNSQKASGDTTGSMWTRLLDAVGNGIAKRQRAAVPSTQEALLVAGKNDEFATFIRTDRKGNITTANYTSEIIEPFEGGTLNVQKWTATSTTFAPVQSTGNGYVINNSNFTTASAVSILQSVRVIPKIPRVPIQLRSRVRLNIPTNATADFGLGIPSGTTLIVPNGFCVRVVNGLWSVAITSNNTELITANITDYATGLTQLNTANTNAEFFVVDMIMDDDNLIVTVQNTQTGLMVGYANLAVPFSALKAFAATALPVYYRLYNAAVSPSTAPNFTIAELQALTLDWNLNYDASQIAAHLGLSSGRHPSTGAQLENHGNSAPPTSATLSNTAAGYTTLGGKFQFTAVAGSTTDYALFGFQVPTNSRFVCEGIHIETYNLGAAVATTSTVLEWAMGFNSSAVSLATANIIRKQVGVQSFPVGAAVGATTNFIDVNFVTPEVTESGRFVHVILNCPLGTATPSQSIRGIVTVKGRFI